MMNEHASVIAFPEKKPVRMCEPSGCELVADMRQAVDLLQKKNEELMATIAELDRLASTDKLTGAWNRRRLDEAVGNEMDRLKRYGRPLSLLIVDVDLFKRVNDRYGHAVGDQLLVELTARIRAVLRTTDSLTRWGGEEFVVLCPDTALATVAILADRLRRAVARMNFSMAEAVTVSIGVAECLPDETWAQWFRRADAMLLQGKAAGRNQVRIAPEIPVRADAADTNPAKLVRLVWHRAYECGHEAIDREHQTLFRDANDLLDAILAGRPARETSAIVETLVRDVSQHFVNEESIVAAAGYPGAAQHAALHRSLADRVDTLVARFHAGEADLGEIFQFLAYDLIARHMLRADSDFFPYLQGGRDAADSQSASALSV